MTQPTQTSPVQLWTDLAQVGMKYWLDIWTHSTLAPDHFWRQVFKPHAPHPHEPHGHLEVPDPIDEQEEQDLFA